MPALLEKLKEALRNPGCRACHRPDDLGEGTLFCPNCQGKFDFRAPQPLLQQGDYRLYAATLFSPRIKRLLYGYKFYDKKHHADLITDILIHYWHSLSAEPTKDQTNLPLVVLPIPARAHRVSHLTPIAKRFAHRLPHGHFLPLLEWTRDTQPQHTLTQKFNRFENVRQSMQVCEKSLKKLPPGPKRLIIIDDLTTTGATMHEAARSLAAVTGETLPVTGLAVCHIPLAFRNSL